MKDITALMWNH